MTDRIRTLTVASVKRGPVVDVPELIARARAIRDLGEGLRNFLDPSKS